MEPSRQASAVAQAVRNNIGPHTREIGGEGEIFAGYEWENVFGEPLTLKVICWDTKPKKPSVNVFAHGNVSRDCVKKLANLVWKLRSYVREVACERFPVELKSIGQVEKDLNTLLRPDR